MNVDNYEANEVDDYEKLLKIGEGTYGKVYKARCTRTGQLVALKKTRMESDEEGVSSVTLREISLLNMLSESEYVVKLLHVKHTIEHDRNMLYLIFEYLEYDLKKYMDLTVRGPGSVLPREKVKHLMYQLCSGIAHCHQHGIMHRDLKPQNILVDEDATVLKIADLGLGRAFTLPMKSYTHEIVTLWYRAPEVLLGGTHYSTPVDVWSIGCIFAELAHKHALFPGNSEFQQLLHIFKILGTPNEEIWPGLSSYKDWHEYPQWWPQDLAYAVPELDPDGIDLLKRMLVYDPKRRIHAIDALNHPYFDSLDKSQYNQSMDMDC